MKRRRFDSDDDDDDIITFAGGVEPQLTKYASASAQGNDALRDTGLDSSASSESPASQNGEEQMEDDSNNRAVFADPTQQTAQVHLNTSSCALDQDVPELLKGLLGDALFSVYAIPLGYMGSQRSMDDKLLAQYLPFNETEAVRQTLVSLTSEETDANPANRFGIQPGWRWDGIMRGTSTT